MSEDDLSEAVTEDATLDAFQTTSEPETEPASGVFVWCPGGVACDDCGAVVPGRWRDGESWLCPSCVQWNRS